MPSYLVEFSSGTGEPIQLAMNAPSLPALAQRLDERGYMLHRVLEAQPDRTLKGYWRKISEGELTTALRQLSGMLDNGVALAPALGLLARESRNLTLRGILLDLDRSVREGGTLAHALSAYPRLFSPLYVRLVEAGEAGARLPEVLRHLADYADRAAQASMRIRTSLVYPQVVGIFTLLVMTLTFMFIVPKWIQLFTDLGVKEFPLVTQVLLVAGSTIIPISVIGAGILAAVAWAVYGRSSRRAPFRIAEVRARLPLIGALYWNFGLLRLTRLLAALLSGGIPLLEALRLAGQGSENPLLQAAMWDAIPHVAAGESLATAFGHAGILPPTFCGQIAAAESGNDFPGALARLSDWYSERVDYLAARVTALVEPILILILAGFAGWIAVGVFAPLVSVIQSLSGGG